MRRSALQLAGSTPADEYLHIPAELVVHHDDSEAAEVVLAPFGYRRNRGNGELVIFAGSTQCGEVSNVVDAVRRSEHRDLRIGPHYGFGACQRVPRSADHAVGTTETLGRLEGDAGSLVVGVVDTGIVLHDDIQHGTPHPWLASRVVPSEIAEGRLPDDRRFLEPGDAHGTFVAGLVLKEAPAASIRMVPALEGGFTSEEIVADAIDTLGREGVKLINLSFSGDTADRGGDRPALLDAALSRLPLDVVVVAAAGNFADDRPAWPASHERVIAVGAVDERSDGSVQPAAFTSFGPWVDAYADGVAVLGPFCWYEESADPDRCDIGSCWHGSDPRRPQRYQGWARWSGTSFAAATVTGAIARLAGDEDIAVQDAAKRLLRSAPTIPVAGLERPHIAGDARS